MYKCYNLSLYIICFQNIVSPTLHQPAGSVEPSDHNDGLDEISSDEEDGELSDGGKESEKNLKRKESDNHSSPLEEGEIRENFPYPNEENMTGQSLKRKRTSICSGPINPPKRRLIILTPKQINQRYKQLSSDSTTTTLSEYNIQTASSSQESQQNFAHQITFNVECSFQLQPIQQVTVQQPNDSHQMYGNTIFSSQENDGHFI